MADSSSKTQNLQTTFFLILFILMMAGICALNAWLGWQFTKLEFTPQTKASQSHTIVEALLWTLVAVSGAMALLLIVMTWKYGSGAYYQIPLIGLIVSLLVYSGFQLTIAYFWKNLQVVNIKSEAYRQISDAILFSGYLTLPIVLIIVGFWWYVNETSLASKYQSKKKSYDSKNCSNYKGKEQSSLEEVKRLFPTEDIDNVHSKAKECNQIYKDMEDIKDKLFQKYGLGEKKPAPNPRLDIGEIRFK